MSKKPILQIRRARRSDQSPLGDLWHRLLNEQAGLDERLGVAVDALARWHNDFPFWLDDEHRQVLVAEQEEILLGFATAQLWFPLPIYENVTEVYIDELYIVPEVRGHGVGRSLLETIREWADAVRADRLRVGVLAENAAARGFWESQEARPFALTYTIELEKGEQVAAPEPRSRIGF